MSRSVTDIINEECVNRSSTIYNHIQYYVEFIDYIIWVSVYIQVFVVLEIV